MREVRAVRIDEGKIGFSRDSEEFRTSTSRLMQFAQVLGLRSGPIAEGRTGHPIFPHIPATQSLVEVLRAATSGFGFHGEQDFRFHAPIVPGQRLFTSSVLQALRQTKAGAATVIRSDLRTADGTLVNVQYTTSVFTEAELSGDGGDKAPAPPELSDLKSSEPETSEIAIDDDLAHRYSDVSRDYSPYTMRQDYARKIGLKAPILHGLCTLGLAARPVLVGAGDPAGARLRRYGCRFSHPLFMTGGRRITVRQWRGEAGSGPAVAFEVADDQGHLILKNGFAEFAP